jgi:hypothetical protein
MSKAIDKHTATNKLGILVQDAGSNETLFRDGSKMMILAWERARTPGGQPAQIVYVDAKIKWQPPNDSEPISQDERSMISANIVEPYRSLGLAIYIHQRG